MIDKKRLFFGFSIEAPWPHSYPEGRVIEELSRHLTLAFLGNCSFGELQKNLEQFPKPDFQIGPVGICDQVLFLPKLKPRVVANHINWMVDGESITQFQAKVLDWLEELSYKVDRRPLLPHITIARAPFEEKAWEDSFEKLPVMISGIHLYESIGNLRYKSLWELPLLLPFEEFEHTADIAFHIHGNTFYELYIHGAMALCFKYPPFLSYLETGQIINDFNDVVAALNHLVAICDQEMGCPIKAVSYHGQIGKKENLMHWEMVVDV